MRFALPAADTGACQQWFGHLPGPWLSLPLRRLFRVVNGGTPSSTDESFWDGGITWITPEDLGGTFGNRIAGSRRTLSSAGLVNCGAQLVPTGSIVISTRAPIGHVAVTTVAACTNQGCRSLVPHPGVCPDYYYYVLIASKQVLQANGKGSTFMELSAGGLASHIVPRPAASAQRAIAEFLDRQTARLDELVTKKRILIEKLEEKRTALISRTVTRGLPPDAALAAGLNPHPKLKPSQIRGLNEIPAHWSVLPLKRIVATPITDGPHETPQFVDSGVPFLSAEAVWDGKLHLPAMRGWISEDSHRLYATKYLPRRDDILIVKSGSTTGKVAIVDFDDEFNVWSPLAAVRCDQRVALPVFIYYSLSSEYFQSLVRVSWSFGTQPNIGMGVIASLHVVLPPLGEQRAIAAYLSREAAGIDEMIAKVESAIDRLQEYRTALISAAVTGKIDVRGVA